MRAENARVKNTLSELQVHSAETLEELIVLRGKIAAADKLIISQHMELEGAFSQNRNMVLQIMGLKEKLEQAGKDLYASQHENIVLKKKVEEYEENYEVELKEDEKELERVYGAKMNKMKTQLAQLKRFAGKNGLFFCPQCKLVLNEGLLCYDCQEINEKNIPPLI